MSWQAELDELAKRQRMAEAMGGPDKVHRQHEGGRLTVRERIEGLADPGSFHEVGAVAGRADYDAGGNLSGFTPSNCVMGRALVDGRPVVIVGDDFTVRGGSADATIRDKPITAERMAADLRLPIIRVIEGSGGGGSVKTIETTGRANLPGGIGGQWLYHHTGDNLARVPVVGLGLGSVAGLGAARLAATHFSIMTKATGAMFVAGPPVVNALGHNLSKTELGGWEIQTKSGAIDHAVETEEEAFAAARRFLSFLPGHVWELPPVTPCADDPKRVEEGWLAAIPRNIRQPYRIRPLIEQLVDAGSFFENRPALLRLRGENLVNLALSHDRVAGPANAGIHEKFLNVLQPTGLAVKSIFTLAVAVNAACDFNFVKLATELFFAVSQE
jgi:acetyl-CoA carboxylase carboxyltransferase component